MRFGDLKTGDVLIFAGQRGVLLAIEKPHPLNSNFWMFVWYILSDRRLSFDMLRPNFHLIEGSSVVSDGFISFRQALEELT